MCKECGAKVDRYSPNKDYCSVQCSVESRRKHRALIPESIVSDNTPRYSSSRSPLKTPKSEGNPSPRQ